MAGILDSKSRVLDFVLTQEGRNQLANDSLEFRFASLSDSACFYRSGSDFAADDASARIYFEANSSPFDQIVVERGPEGQSVVGFGVNTGSIRIVGETIYQSTGSTSPVAAATTTFSFTKGSGLHGLTAGQRLTLTDVAGTKVDYFVSDTGDGGAAHLAAVANGATLKSTGGIKAERSLNSDRGIAVGFNLGAALPGGTDQAEFAALLKAAIEHARGHGGTITVGDAPTAVDAVVTMKLTQASTGHLGNRQISENLSNLSAPNFSGGKDDLLGSGIVPGSAIDDADLIMRGITDNLKSLNMIGGYDPFNDSSDFKIRLSSGKKIDEDTYESTFTISDTVPWNLKSPVESDRKQLDLELSESFFEDDRTNFVDNFLYLPPINKLDDSGVRYPLAEYENLSRTPRTTLDDIERSFVIDDDQLNLPESKRLYKKEFIDITFDDTSRDNNLMIQPFEFRDKSIRKLETVDFGEYIDEDTGERTRVFFVGKVITDFTGTDKFINLFTVVCKNDEVIARNRGVT